MEVLEYRKKIEVELRSPKILGNPREFLKIPEHPQKNSTTILENPMQRIAKPRNPYKNRTHL